MKPASLLPFVLLAAAFWLLVIRPGQRQRAAKAALIDSLRPGAEIVTTAGLHGTVIAIDDDDVVLEIAEGVHVRFLRSAIGAVQAPSDEDEAGHESDESTDEGSSVDAEDPDKPALTDSSDPSEPTT